MLRLALLVLGACGLYWGLGLAARWLVRSVFGPGTSCDRHGRTVVPPGRKGQVTP